MHVHRQVCWLLTSALLGRRTSPKAAAKWHVAEDCKLQGEAGCRHGEEGAWANRDHLCPDEKREQEQQSPGGEINHQAAGRGDSPGASSACQVSLGILCLLFRVLEVLCEPCGSEVRSFSASEIVLWASSLAL